MELWIRSTARTNLVKVNCLTIMEGSNFYTKSEWEYKGYTIADAEGSKEYVLLGTYKTKERALEVLDEIINLMLPVKTGFDENGEYSGKGCFANKDMMFYEMPKE